MVVETRSPEETFALGEKIGRTALPGQDLHADRRSRSGQNSADAGGCRRTGDPGGGEQPPHLRSCRCMRRAGCPFIILTYTGSGDIEEMEEIGYDDYFFGNGVCLIEWAELIADILPEEHISIKIEKDLSQGFDYRRITVEGLPDEGESERL